ncbi:thiol-disulfide oxidoreductase DCC family protein [Mumia sp. ZJ1417]|uniref:thiol-disulfide oxidoreductase DCC family protein n=1 Tax=Mumia sp. ZJ1417 TaxID=2708082 RepID=UPI001AB0581E|nr:DCC1-like thiol-disulfide oxidoreductase family protein [Mumia sp. ZJ1417]
MTAVLLYDGDCAFCSSCARWLQRWAPARAEVLAWQLTDLEALHVNVADVDTAVQWIDDSARAAGPEAIAAYLRTAGAPWRVAGRVLACAPVRGVAWPVYRWIAAHRDKLPGGTPQCALPSTAREPGHGPGGKTAS